MVWFNRIVSLAGFLGFGALLLFVLLAPAKVEQSARAFIVSEVQQALAPALESKAGQKLQSAFKKWQEKRKKGEDGEAVSGVAKRLAPIVQKLCYYGCEDRAALEAKIEEDLNKAATATEKARAKLVAAAQAKFQSAVIKIRNELLIFTGSNVAIFALLFLTSFLGAAAQRALALPSAVLAVSTLVFAGFYIFGQNWFHTILFDNYIGYGYLSLLAFFALVFLCIYQVRSAPGDLRIEPHHGGVAGGETLAAPVEAAGEAANAGAESLGAFSAVAETVVSCIEAVVDAIFSVFSAS